MRTALALVLSIAVVVSAQQPATNSEQLYVTAVEVVADVRDAKGNVPAGLQPADFVVLENGIQRTVVGVEYLRAPKGAKVQTAAAPAPAAEQPRQTLWQNVLYFETALSNSAGRISAAKEMMKHVDRLVQMGTVDVVLADPTPVALVRNSRDAAAIRKALEKIVASKGTNQLAAHRRQFNREVGALGNMEAWKTSQIQQTVRTDYEERPYIEVEDERDRKYKYTMDPKGREELDGTKDPLRVIGTNEILPYVEQEIAAISNFRDSLVAWLSSYPRRVPRNLLMVTDGFDLDPAEFYGEAASPTVRLALKSYVSSAQIGGSAARMAEMLVAGAWTSVLIPSDNYNDGYVDDTSTSGIGRVGGARYVKPMGNPKAFFYRPHDPLNAMAEVTGGKVVPNSSHLRGVMEGLDDRLKITYQVDRKPDGQTRKVEVKPRDPNLTVRTARFVMATTPDEVARTRALGLINGATYTGDLSTEGTVEWEATNGPKKSGTLRAVANVDLVKRMLGAESRGHFRITMAIRVGTEAVVAYRAVPNYDLKDGVFRFRTPIDVPPAASSILLVIEETTTGIWGSTRVDISTAAVPAS